MNKESREIVTTRFNEVLKSLGTGAFDLIISHQGELSKEKVNSIAYETEKNLKESGTKKGATKRIFSIIIEALQNIRLHGASDKEGMQDAYIVVGRSSDEFVIATANLVFKEQVLKVSTMLENINKLDRIELKELYMQTLTDGMISSKGGAGLGFITIAMKSKNKLGFQFIPAGGDLHFFELKARISVN